MTRQMRIAIVAGELSGDQLGAGLIEALGKIFPDAIFEGVGGPGMEQLGFNSLYSMDRLSVMGLAEPLKRLPELLGIRRRLIRYFGENPPDVLIGIDSPDFNLGLEEKLRRRGIRTVHYVSPSVWAWRQGRVRRIARAVDLILTLLPFEAAFYQSHQVPVCFVGHPLADQIPLENDTGEARRKLGLNEHARVLAVLPGSRESEVKWLAPVFFDAVHDLVREMPGLLVVIPAANEERRRQIETLLKDLDLSARVLEGQSLSAMSAADAVLLASGTVSLEAMLLKKPMVICYRMGWFSAAILGRMIKTRFISLPNLLAGRELVPELLQEEVTSEAICRHLRAFFESGEQVALLREQFTELHVRIRANASEKAAKAVADLIKLPSGERIID